MNDIEDVIEQYKKELIREAEIARDDLEEIEDHLRTLTMELRESGMSSADAVRAACAQLGNPRAVAREHAKVHSPFGARLSWARTLSAAAIMIVGLVVGCVAMWNDGAPLPMVGMMIFWTMLIAALLARVTWGRAVALGAVGYMTTLLVLTTIAWPDGAHGLLRPDLFWLGISAFVMPWRRHELSGTGYALVLQSFAFVAADLTPDHIVPVTLIGFMAPLVAIAGTILRARWASLASAFTGVILLVFTVVVANYYFFVVDEFEYAREWLPLTSMLFAGAIASFVAAVISWRSARSNMGTLRYARR